MDHGHPVELGLTLTPSADGLAALTDLARLAESEGLDVVAITAGPVVEVVPAGGGREPKSALDPWTVLGWLAARTSRIALSADGLAVDGPPTVLARAAASLDLLSGGRLRLGLAPDAPGLAEALGVLRGMWAGGPEPLRADGPVHPVPGAARGPVPAHDLPVWVGGSGPAAVALAAASADGWWTRLDAGATETAVHAQKAFDVAAEAAGRDPAEVRRLVTLATPLPADADRAVDELAALVLEAGVGTLLLAVDPADPGAPDAVRRFAHDVAPILRGRVAATRSARGTATPSTRPARVRAQRRDGIDYDAVPVGLDAVEPGDLRHAAMRSTYLRGGRPGLVLLPRDADEVGTALTWARTQPVPLAVRSGGHGISGRSTNDGGIVLDLRRLDTIEVLDVATRRVRIGPGARWGEVAEALAPYGWALTSGDYGGVGVGGLATAGGIGFLAREHGLTLDHLRAAEVVLADGTRLRTDAEQHPDLFWGVRGAGGNLGVVTAFEFEVDEVGDVGFAQLAFAVDDLAAFLVGYGALVEAAPRDLTAFLIMGRPQRGEVVAQLMAVVDSDDPETIIDRLQPFAMLAPLVQQSVRVVPYPAVVQRTANVHEGQGDPVTRAGALEHLTRTVAEDAERLVRSGDVYFFQLRSSGGAVADVPVDATAYAHRSANFQVVAFGASRSRLDAHWDAMAHHWSGLYSSFETDPRPERVDDAYPGATGVRLRELKRRYDPDNVFRHNLPIAP